MESLVLRIHTVDVQNFNLRVYMQPGVPAYKRIPDELRNGVWIDEKNFIPATAIVRAEVVIGTVEFPE